MLIIGIAVPRLQRRAVFTFIPDIIYWRVRPVACFEAPMKQFDNDFQTTAGAMPVQVRSTAASTELCYCATLLKKERSPGLMWLEHYWKGSFKDAHIRCNITVSLEKIWADGQRFTVDMQNHQSSTVENCSLSLKNVLNHRSRTKANAI